ncbi:nucleotidyltransferase family protein [Lyngbya confervoides]|uniref:Nucleotidyltransferase domain-containing protein n=1 Tax=Lyngbya confervoides BDU141951 TaxID=1574623 RepID=A0ABD4T866_9CYAN|nr:nucleotidyltransferase domain-containing protein [Lyngbya confervoides]MCM1984761.1 nucleotidyltransferase domain-containing protein [Lyngbya confervoides BDU141951]
MVELSHTELAQYRATAQRRQTAHAQQQVQRQRQGWQVARQAARVLKQEFGVQQVWLFGSMLEARRVRLELDIDLAVAGLADDRYLEAVAQLLDLSAFAVDVVQMEHAKPRLREVIEQQGVEL